MCQSVCVDLRVEICWACDCCAWELDQIDVELWWKFCASGTINLVLLQVLCKQLSSCEDYLELLSLASQVEVVCSSSKMFLHENYLSGCSYEQWATICVWHVKELCQFDWSKSLWALRVVNCLVLHWSNWLEAIHLESCKSPSPIDSSSTSNGWVWESWNILALQMRKHIYDRLELLEVDSTVIARR